MCGKSSMLCFFVEQERVHREADRPCARLPKINRETLCAAVSGPEAVHRSKDQLRAHLPTDEARGVRVLCRLGNRNDHRGRMSETHLPLILPQRWPLHRPGHVYLPGRIHRAAVRRGHQRVQTAQTVRPDVLQHGRIVLLHLPRGLPTSVGPTKLQKNG
uniref:(northern house mosquito) hypothetical protein n=1 Tax=Culex pipiens TaxID=7175 RepID=A0A8D8FU85_CULPI